MTPDTSAHDGRFDVTVISSRSLWDVLLVLFRMLTWRYKGTSRLHHFQARKVVIATDPPVPVQVDGEDIGYLHQGNRKYPVALRLGLAEGDKAANDTAKFFAYKGAMLLLQRREALNVELRIVEPVDE